MSAADCGATFGHDPHGYLTSDNKVKACDGSTTKPTTSPPPNPSPTEGD